MRNVEEWFKTKKYPHIGLPITIKDYSRVTLYVNNPEKIKKHSFLPFIHKTILKRKFRGDKDKPTKNLSGKSRRIKSKPKVRDTFFASHLDAMIFSKYNSILTEAYERYIECKPFNEPIVAYRKISIGNGTKGNKCNIDFAKSAFEYIQNNKDKKLSVIVADITSFFDNLDHKVLKRQWSKVLQEPTLPAAHYNVYKALTRIKYVESQQLFEAYKETMLVERGVPNSSTQKEFVRRGINDTKYFKENNAVAYCNKEEFIQNNLNLIISKNKKSGIPQGSPISATLANIYMLDFDETIFTEIDKIHGFYQRYSDDLIIVCEQIYEEDILKILRDKVNSKEVNLTIEQNKTKLYHFETIADRFKGFAVDEKTKKPNHNRALEYLGFYFDGGRVLIKNVGFSKFYRSMKAGFNKAAGFAKHSKNPDKRLFKSRLYKRFTYKGAARRLKYRPSKLNPKKYEKTREYNWGNYLSYVYKANEAMKTINKNDAIKMQSRRVWTEFHKLMRHHEEVLKPTK